MRRSSAEAAAQAEGDDEDSDKKSVFFEYDLAGGKLTLLPEFENPKKPRWASVSPDDKIIVFARGNNLFMMDAANYAKARKTPGDTSVVETQITTDGEEHFAYKRRLNDEDRRRCRKDSKDDKHTMGAARAVAADFLGQGLEAFALVRRDERKVADLFVINALSTPRPTLESYSLRDAGRSQHRRSRRSRSSMSRPRAA